jgi:DNA-binding SARP family transcriptional activator/tetratricopeptide (TPR) repeat protein
MLQLRLLGEPILFDEPKGIRPLWRTQSALLAFLALAPDARASRSFLAGIFWPETPDAAARRSLRQALFHLRRNAGAVIACTGEYVCLDLNRVEIDVFRFEQLLAAERYREAVALYSADFLNTFTLGSSPFDEWADRQRSRLAARASTAYAALTDAAAAQGRWAEAVQWAEQWALREPFSELAVCRLVALRAQTGDRAGALAEYDSFRTRLHAELGVAPGSDLEDLAERLQRLPVTPPLRPPPTPAVPRSLRVPVPLVGREAEFARLHAAWESVRAGERRFLLVTGEAGIGKTRLVQEFGSWADLEGATVLRGRAYEVEREVPYSTLAGVLRGALHAPGLAGTDAACLGELSRIVPEFATRYRGLTVPLAADLETGRLRVLDALRTVFENLAYEAPVLLIVDDLAWADPATLAALHYLWRGLDATALLVLATARSFDTSAEEPVQQLLNSLRREAADAVDRILLEPLPLESIARLAHELGGNSLDNTLAMALREETGGNPLFLIEALRARLEGSATSASPTVRAVVAERVGSLTTAAHELLRAAAVLGRNFPFPFAAALASLRHPEAIAALEELLSRRLLQQVEYGYDFLHDVVRQTVYEDLGTERRRLLHRLALERLTPVHGEAVGLERASRLALHAERSELPNEAVHWLLRSAALARDIFAGTEAERFLERALEASESGSERGTILEQIGDVRFAQSRFAAAALTYRQVIPAIAPGSTERLRIRTKLLDASLRAGLFDLESAADAIGRLTTDAEAAGPVCHRDVLIAVASAHLRAGHFASAETHAAGAVAAARAAAIPHPLVKALLLQAQAATLCRSPADVLPTLAEAVRVAAEHDLQRDLCDAETDYATELCRQDRWDEAITTWIDVVARGTQAGAMGAVAVAAVNLADVLLRRGEWKRASEYLQQAEELAQRFSFSHVTADALVNQAMLSWQQDRSAASVDFATAAIEYATAHRIDAAVRTARSLRLIGLLALGRLVDAQREMEALSALGSVSHPTWGDDGELVAVAQARMAVSRGEHARAVPLLARALEEARDSYTAALLQLEIAEALWAQHPQEAGEVAERAAACASRLDAKPLYARAAALISGLPPPRWLSPSARREHGDNYEQ